MRGRFRALARRKAEQLILDLSERMDDLLPGIGRQTTGDKTEPGGEDAIRALVSLGYSPLDAERAVKSAIDEGGKGMPAADLIRRALAKVGSR